MHTILPLKAARTFILSAAVLALGLAACAQPTATAEPTLPPPAVATEPPEAPAATQAPSGAPAEEENPAEPEPAAEAGAEAVWTLAAEGNEARYLVNEQLASLDFPTDAIGATNAVSGQIVVRADGSVASEQSRFTVDLTTLVSDRDMRDRYVQRNTLQTSSFPVVEFVPTEASGLPAPLPTAGEVAFQLSGDMTLHGVTQPVTWNVTGAVADGVFNGTAATSFPFSTFGLAIPQVMSVLSVEDNIRLEYDFSLVQQTG